MSPVIHSGRVDIAPIYQNSLESFGERLDQKSVTGVSDNATSEKHMPSVIVISSDQQIPVFQWRNATNRPLQTSAPTLRSVASQ